MVTPTGRNTLGQDQEVAFGYSIPSLEAGITAHAGGTKAAAYQLANQINQVSVCATGGDSLLLPLGKVGMSVLIINDGAAAAQVFGKSNDTIDGIATGTGVVLTNAKRCWYHCTSVASGVGAWQSNMGVVSA